MLSPQWAHLRGASLTRGGIDYRNAVRKLLLWDNFKSTADEINGFKRMRVLLTAGRSDEPGVIEQPPVGSTAEQVIVFSGQRKRYDDFRGWHEFIHAALRDMTRPKWLQLVDKYTDVPIGINPRRGKDFVDASVDDDFLKRGALRTPLKWFVDVLQEIRAFLGSTTKAFVVSDGTREDLGPLLCLPNVELVKSPSAISDLLVLAKSQILIGSGGSSFSAWASFLGQMPTISHEGQSLNWYKVSNDVSKHYVGEFIPGTANKDFFDQVSRTMLKIEGERNANNPDSNDD